MIDTRALEKAVATGVIDMDQAERIMAIAGELEPLPPPAPPLPPQPAEAEDDDLRDPENLRFVRGFADIFVTVGIALVVGPAIYFSGTRFAESSAVAATVAVLAWLLAEYFTRTRRMALPSIVLLGIFTAAVAALFLDLMVNVEIDSVRQVPGLRDWPLPSAWDDSTRSIALRAAPAALLTAVAVVIYYLRFRVPIAVAAGVGALVALVLAAVAFLAPDFAEANVRWLTFACGIVVFLLAMRFDMADPDRLTLRTDIAFWLHVLAAPLIVHTALSGIVDPEADVLSADQAARVLAVFGIIGLVSVLIDRRSFLVAGLGYAGFAFRSLLGDAGVVDAAVPSTLLILGAMILVLSAGWTPLRRLLMSSAPPALARRLPPLRT